MYKADLKDNLPKGGGAGVIIPKLISYWWRAAGWVRRGMKSLKLWTFPKQGQSGLYPSERASRQRVGGASSQKSRNFANKKVLHQWQYGKGTRATAMYFWSVLRGSRGF